MAKDLTPHGPWKCFHCWEVFHNPTQAAMHFGATPDAEPMCRVPRKDWPLAYAYRELEQEIARYRAGDSDKDRALHAMRDIHARDLRRAEESGYEKGLRDGMAEASKEERTMDVCGTVLADISAERRRQVALEGFGPKHDDAHTAGQLARAAAAYALSASRSYLPVQLAWIWPWSTEWWKPKDRRRDLVRAGALIVAEIERHDRAVAAARGD